jgi:hypothetical protein
MYRCQKDSFLITAISFLSHISGQFKAIMKHFVVPKQPELRHISSLPAVFHVSLQSLQSLATLQNYIYERTAASVTVRSGMYYVYFGPEAHSVHRLATGWKVRGSNLCRGEIFAYVHPGLETHPASCKMGTGFFPGDKAARA